MMTVANKYIYIFFKLCIVPFRSNRQQSVQGLNVNVMLFLRFKTKRTHFTFAISSTKHRQNYYIKIKWNDKAKMKKTGLNK